MRMSRIIDTGLDAFGQRHTTLGGHVFVFLVEFRIVTESHGAEVAVLGEILNGDFLEKTVTYF